jgi:hypothetical protein
MIRSGGISLSLESFLIFFVSEQVDENPPCYLPVIMSKLFSLSISKTGSTHIMSLHGASHGFQSDPRILTIVELLVF